MVLRVLGMFLFLLVTPASLKAEIPDWRKSLDFETLQKNPEERKAIMLLAERLRGPNGYETFKGISGKQALDYVRISTLRAMMRPYAEKLAEEKLEPYMTEKDWENVKRLEEETGNLYRQQFWFGCFKGEVTIAAHRLSGPDWRRIKEQMAGAEGRLVQSYGLLTYIYSRYDSMTPEEIVAHQAQLTAKAGERKRKKEEEEQKLEAERRKEQEEARKEEEARRAEEQRRMADIQDARRSGGQLSLAKNYARSAAYDKAIQTAQKLIDDYPGSVAAREAEELLKQWKEKLQEGGEPKP